MKAVAEDTRIRVECPECHREFVGRRRWRMNPNPERMLVPQHLNLAGDARCLGTSAEVST